MQTTLKASVSFEGTGLHSGAPVHLVVHPAPVDFGIRFRRTDICVGDSLVAALWDRVEQTPLCTRIVNESGASVSTVEHLMAALSGCGIHNAIIEIDGPEVPILDGSSMPFVRAFLRRGLRHQSAQVRAIQLRRPVEFHTDAGWARLIPAASLVIDFRIEFADAAIGTQSKELDMANGAFVRELCDSRTFCRNADVLAMRANGLALGGTFENAVVVEGEKVLSPGGLRHKDEAVRHKMLDALGDLALAGAPILGRYTGVRAGHAITNSLLHVLFSDPSNFRVVECDPVLRARLPGAGVRVDELVEVA